MDYTETSTGLKILSLHFAGRGSGEGAGAGESRPRVPRGALWTDEEFGLTEAMEGLKVDSKNMSWKRPHEIRDNPQLFTHGVSHYDIGQGAAGTCWFLATAAGIGRNEEQLKLVFPDDAYPVGTDGYDGVLHCRFWRFGQWQDVYIDDHLPVIYNSRPWGAYSDSDKNEFWVALLEKAFASQHGSYKAVYGGQPGDAYLALTGGVAERIDFEEDRPPKEQLYRRIRNAILSGSFVTCAVPEKHHKVHGLVGAHAYTVTGTTRVRNTDLLRIRNPWGNTEWTGPWSDGSSEWAGIGREVKDDGEFWISLDDFIEMFNQTTVCSLTPDFDMDGRTDAMNYVTNLYGEWRGDTAAGPHNRLKNPRYVFTVNEDDDFVDPLVVQLIQWREHRKMDNFQARCDLYRVLQEDSDLLTVELMGQNTTQYSPATQTTFRHKVTPGTYVVVPSTIEPGQEKSFLIRVFTDCPLRNIRELPRHIRLMSCASQQSITHQGKEYYLRYRLVTSGQWKAGKNAGGQIGRGRSYATNPQYRISVKQDTLVSIHLMQEQTDPQMPLGLRLYPTGEAPMSYDTIYSMYDKALVDTEGNQFSFVRGWAMSSAYLLTTGHYTMVIHLDDHDDEKVYTLYVKADQPLDVTGYQTEKAT